MSLFEPRFARIGLVVSATLLVSGCLKPMYGGIEGAALRSELAAIAVDPIPERAGHYLANELHFALNGTGADVPPKYHLQVVLRERVQTTLVDSITGRATSGSVVIDADYKLLPVGGGPVVTSGLAFTFASYDRSSQRFANIRAARDAEIRDAKALADQIKTRIAIALARN